MKHFLFLIPLGFLAPLLPARAAFNPAIVGADAKWAVSVDLNELRESALGKQIIATVQKKIQAPVPGPGGSSTGTVSIDFVKLSTTIGRVTAYGANFAQKPDEVDGALIAEGTPDLRKMVESVLLQMTLANPKECAEVEGLPFPAYTIKNEVFVAFPSEPIVIVSKSKAQVLKAHDVFRGKAPNLAKTAKTELGALLTPAPKGYIVAASVTPADKAFSGDGPQTRILQLVQSGALALGEAEAKTTAHLQLMASSDAQATKLQKIVEGMTAMLSLAETSDRQLSEFMQSAKVRREDRSITVDLAYSSERLAQMLESLQKQTVNVSSPRREHPLTNGKAVAEWTAANTEDTTRGDSVCTRTIENVSLVNGATITLGRSMGGGRTARFERLEIAPAGGGMGMVFRREMLRSNGPVQTQVVFPGTDGRYTLKVSYADDIDSNTKLAVSVREPRAPNTGPEAAAKSASPIIPEPKGK